MTAAAAAPVCGRAACPAHLYSGGSCQTPGGVGWGRVAHWLQLDIHTHMYTYTTMEATCAIMDATCAIEEATCAIMETTCAIL